MDQTSDNKKIDMMHLHPSIFSCWKLTIIIHIPSEILYIYYTDLKQEREILIQDKERTETTLILNRRQRETFWSYRTDSTLILVKRPGRDITSLVRASIYYTDHNDFCHTAAGRDILILGRVNRSHTNSYHISGERYNDPQVSVRILY